MRGEEARIKIILADDHTLLREGLGQLLSKNPRIHLIGEARDGQELITLVRQHRPDVVVTDIAMPGLNGIEATTILIREFPRLGIIALSMFEETHLIVDIVEAGARGYLLKNADKEELLKAIDVVFEGGTFYTPQVADKLISLATKTIFTRAYPALLTPQEIEIISLICQQYSSKEIGVRLNLKKRSVESYREKIQRKIGARNMIGIVLYAIKEGLYRIR